MGFLTWCDGSSLFSPLLPKKRMGQLPLSPKHANCHFVFFISRWGFTGLPEYFKCVAKTMMKTHRDRSGTFSSKLDDIFHPRLAHPKPVSSTDIFIQKSFIQQWFHPIMVQSGFIQYFSSFNLGHFPRPLLSFPGAPCPGPPFPSEESSR